MTALMKRYIDKKMLTLYVPSFNDAIAIVATLEPGRYNNINDITIALHPTKRCKLTHHSALINKSGLCQLVERLNQRWS